MRITKKIMVANIKETTQSKIDQAIKILALDFREDQLLRAIADQYDSFAYDERWNSKHAKRYRLIADRLRKLACIDRIGVRATRRRKGETEFEFFARLDSMA